MVFIHFIKSYLEMAMQNHLGEEFKMRRILSAIVAISFIFTNTGFAQLTNLPESGAVAVQTGPMGKKFVHDLTVPDSFGTVRETHQGTSGKTIIYIQDAHVNYEAQLNEAKLIEYLHKEYGVRLILVEGGSGNENLSFLREEATPEVRLEVATKYLKKGLISAEEYLDLISDYALDIEGIENKDLYVSNYRALVRAEELQKNLMPFVERMERAVQSLKDKLYPVKLLELEELRKKVSDFSTKQDGSEYLDYYRRLQELAREEGIDLSGFHNFSELLTLAKNEPEFDVTVLREEYQKLEKAVSAFQAPDSGTEQAEERAPLSNVRAYLQNEHVRALDYPNLAQYAAHLDRLEALRHEELFGEVKQIEDKFYRHFLSAVSVSELSKISRNIAVFKNLITLRLTPEEYRQYQKEARDFYLPLWLFFVKRLAWENGVRVSLPFRTPLTFGLMRDLDQFYSRAKDREESFLSNITKLMDKKNQSTAILITGGFHTEYLTQQFKSHNISYALVSPKFSSATAPGFYESVMKLKMEGKREAVKKFLAARAIEDRPPATVEAAPVLEALRAELRTGYTFEKNWSYGRVYEERYLEVEKTNPTIERAILSGRFFALKDILKIDLEALFQETAQVDLPRWETVVGDEVEKLARLLREHKMSEEEFSKKRAAIRKRALRILVAERIADTFMKAIDNRNVETAGMVRDRMIQSLMDPETAKRLKQGFKLIQDIARESRDADFASRRFVLVIEDKFSPTIYSAYDHKEQPYGVLAHSGRLGKAGLEVNKSIYLGLNSTDLVYDDQFDIKKNRDRFKVLLHRENENLRLSQKAEITRRDKEELDIFIKDLYAAHEKAQERRLSRQNVQVIFPATNEKFLQRALESEADMIIIDLEDSVSPTMKLEARLQVIRQLLHENYNFHTKSVFVRINNVRSKWAAGDLREVISKVGDRIERHLLVQPLVDGVGADRAHQDGVAVGNGDLAGGAGEERFEFFEVAFDDEDDVGHAADDLLDVPRSGPHLDLGER